MLKSAIYFLGVLCFTVFKINGQSPDPTFCNINQIPVRPNPLVFPKIDYGKYEARVEQNTNDSKGIVTTEETHEFFDGDDNIGAAKAHFDGVTLYTYSYYNIDELLMVGEDNQCTVRKLSEWYSVSPFFVINTSDGEKILSPLQYLLNSATFGPVVSTNDSIIRGIPVNQWETCLYSTKSMATLRVTIAFSDPTKWNPAGNTPPAVSAVPVSLKIKSKTTTGVFAEDIFSITEFRTFIVEGEERFRTPSGVYCEGRKNTVHLPKVPHQFEFHAEIVTPFFMDLVGTIESIRESYDFGDNLYRQDRSVSNALETEIHDYNTGLNYRLRSGNCKIEKLLPVGPDVVLDDKGKISIRNPKEFFDFDSKNFQFTGRAVMNGVLTDVWIGKKNLTDNTYATYEWYFMDKKWVDVDYIGKNISVPIYAKVSVFANSSQPTYLWYTFSDFQDKKTLLADHDISSCGQGVEKKRLYFNISCNCPGLDIAKVRNNWIYFENHILKEIQKKARVTQLRIVNLEIITSDNLEEDIEVRFELFDKPEFYGDVNFPKDFKDASLKKAVDHLKTAINANTFAFNLTIDDDGNKQRFVARTKTLMELRDKDEPTGVSSGAVAGITIAVIIVGLVISLGLVFLYKKKFSS